MEIRTTVLETGGDVDELLEDRTPVDGSYAYDEYGRRWYLWTDEKCVMRATYPGAGHHPSVVFGEHAVTVALDALPRPVTVVEVYL